MITRPQPQRSRDGPRNLGLADVCHLLQRISSSSIETTGYYLILEDLCDLLPHPGEVKDSLFPEDRPPQLSLEEATQVISVKLSAIGKNIREEIAELIEDLDRDDDIKDIEKFFSNRSFRVVTTNYDKLAEELTGENSCQSITPGRPIPRSSANVKIYHVHGSVDSPENMVVTSEDYFRFINSDTYFSRKLSTVLHENTGATHLNKARVIKDFE